MIRLSRTSITRHVAVALVVAATFAGCSSSGTIVSPVGETILKQLKIEQQPEAINSLKAVYASLTTSQPATAQAANAEPAVTEVAQPPTTEVAQSAPAAPQSITVAGRIYALGTSPFDAKESVFTIVELPKQTAHKHEDPGDCPFCLRELKNSKIAIVRIVDSSGKTYPTPADKLLGLKKLQDIVVQGKANFVGDTLVIELEGLHLLNEAGAAELSTAFHGS